LEGNHVRQDSRFFYEEDNNSERLPLGTGSVIWDLNKIKK
jgi:hypothetical protein